MKWFKVEKDQIQMADRMARQWSGFLLWVAGAKVEVLGASKIPTSEAIVYVANHQSNFDIPLMLNKLPHTKGFIAKIETRKIPLVRTWMSFLKCVFIDRSDIRQQVKALGEGIENIKNGQSMVIFPEGTRSPDGELGDFKPGSLKLATKSKAKIVPVAILNSRGLMGKKDWKIKSAEVKLVVCDPMEMTDAMNRETTELANQIKNIIENEMKKGESYE